MHSEVVCIAGEAISGVMQTERNQSHRAALSCMVSFV